MMKEALIRVRRECKGTGIKILNTVHDELNAHAPGRSWIDETKVTIDNEGRCLDKEGKLTFPKFAWDDEAEQAAKLIHQIMVEVETEFFRAAGSPLTGRAEYNIGPIWLH